MCATYLALFIASFTAAFSFGFMTSHTAAVPQAAEAVAVAPPAQADLIGCVYGATDDEANMLALVGNTFDPSEWSLETSEQDSKNVATWRSDWSGALVFMEYLHYDCGVSEAQIDEYFSPKGFYILFLNYFSFEETAACRVGGLRLYEFDAVFDGADYHTQYYVEQVSPTRVVGIDLIFPAGYRDKLVGYASRLYPELPSCAAAS
jgi:hypothetical protein